jgi:transcriptional regulator GlxA family with amidase domain
MGAHKPGYKLTEVELEFVRKSYDHCVALLNICGGIIAAEMAGMLKGKTCTAPEAY